MRRFQLLLLVLAAALAPAAHARLPVQRVEVVRAYPHDAGAFTQGLFFQDGHLFESTGQFGFSTLRKVRLADGKVVQSASMPASVFGEGITASGREIVGLTWIGGRGFRWDARTLKPLGEWRYPGQGWGLARIGGEIALSDGTSTLRFLDPATLKERRRVTVLAEGRPIERLNELEAVNGEILANIWHEDAIARIDPGTGAVRGWIDLSGLSTGLDLTDPEAVANGIAWDARGRRLFLTGKLWPKLFEVRLTPAGPN